MFPGFRPTNAIDVSRDSYAGYVELDADVNDMLHAAGGGPVRAFQRFRRHRGTARSPARFEPIKGIAVRGSVSTGFRAPSLAQQFFATTSTNSTVVNGVPTADRDRHLPGDQRRSAWRSAASSSTPEKALNLAGGIALNPFSGFSLTADYYNIRIKDRVTLTENLTGTTVVNLLTAAGITGVTSARFFVNGVDTRTQGVDIVGTYRVPEFGFGQVRADRRLQL